MVLAPSRTRSPSSAMSLRVPFLVHRPTPVDTKRKECSMKARDRRSQAKRPPTVPTIHCMRQYQSILTLSASFFLAFFTVRIETSTKPRSSTPCCAVAIRKSLPPHIRYVKTLRSSTVWMKPSKAQRLKYAPSLACS